MKLYSNQPGLERELAKKRFETAVMIDAADGPAEFAQPKRRAIFCPRPIGRTGVHDTLMRLKLV